MCCLICLPIFLEILLLLLYISRLFLLFNNIEYWWYSFCLNLREQLVAFGLFAIISTVIFFSNILHINQKDVMFINFVLQYMFKVHLNVYSAIVSFLNFYLLPLTFSFISIIPISYVNRCFLFGLMVSVLFLK